MLLISIIIYLLFVNLLSRFFILDSAGPQKNLTSCQYSAWQCSPGDPNKEIKNSLLTAHFYSCSGLITVIMRCCDMEPVYSI